MFNKSSRSAFARIILALMLFAQGAMAWSACELPERAPERALRGASMPSGCDQVMSEEVRDAVSAVCFAHCLAGKQSLDRAALDVPVISFDGALIVAAAADADWSSRTAPYLFTIVPGTGPPRRILLQSFQI